ncbi:CBS domain-containing protein [Pseudomonas sp. gcc21]|uniref:HPP family protein n=1 Tax=Pseudomonas sp. gcc21 TaxID=2726989 RepID=UPI00145236D6|nr:CBS domain-containing protein [Pseudomonas sp. gcc21]QJD58290.1 CBS domain-containing protein [Pseudomonas sp. gcc21]
MLQQFFLLSARVVGWLPQAVTTRPGEWLRLSVGLVLSLGVSAWLCQFLFGHGIAVALTGPLAASAILLLAVPSGALAQPWSLLGSYLVALAVASVLAAAFGASIEVACLAAGLALLLMFPLRCLHPPGGAMAMVLVLAGNWIQGSGWALILPVMTVALSLLVCARVFNHLTGTKHKATEPINTHHTMDPVAERRVGINDEDLDSALDEFGEFVDINREDLQQIVRNTERSAMRRHMRDTCAAQIMSRDVLSVTPDTSVLQTLQMLRHHHVKTVPVIDQKGVLVGIVSLGDLMGQVDASPGRLFAARMKIWREQPVSKWMTSPVISADSQMHIVDMIPLMSRHGLHSLPIMDDGKLVGLVTQTDLIAALHQDLLMHL